jgi:hypothetical protein
MVNSHFILEGISVRVREIFTSVLTGLREGTKQGSMGSNERLTFPHEPRESDQVPKRHAVGRGSRERARYGVIAKRRSETQRHCEHLLTMAAYRPIVMVVAGVLGGRPSNVLTRRFACVV